MPDDAAPDPQTASHEPVYRALREAIMRGDIRPGDRMVVKPLSERFGTSALPVRHALQRLVAEGALTDEPYRGARLPLRGVDELMDLRRVRCAIEGQAADWAATRITGEELRRLHDLQARMKAVDDIARAENYLIWNYEFHFIVYRAARSPLLIPLIERLWLRAGPYLNALRTEFTLGQGLDHHDDVLAAMARGDGAAARAAVEAELSEAAEVMVRAMLRRGETDDEKSQPEQGEQR
ncbi:MAG: GntR family transcriptional regulator [Gemmobacter sp.]